MRNYWKICWVRMKLKFWYWVICDVPFIDDRDIFYRGRVGNRHIIKARISDLHLTITTEDTKEGRYYSREDLYSMLCEIRKQEIRQGLKVPEPFCEEIGLGHKWTTGFPVCCLICGDAQHDFLLRRLEKLKVSMGYINIGRD